MILEVAGSGGWWCLLGVVVVGEEEGRVENKCRSVGGTWRWDCIGVGRKREGGGGDRD